MCVAAEAASATQLIPRLERVQPTDQPDPLPALLFFFVFPKEHMSRILGFLL